MKPEVFPRPTVLVCTLFLIVLSLHLIPVQLIAQSQDSRAGDEQALEDLYVATNGSNWSNNTGWSSSGMSLSDNIYGVEVTSIGGELRVTEIDLRDNNLTGNIEISSIGNLKEMKLFSVMLNSINSDIPSSITACSSLEYLYLSGSDYVVDLRNEHPHEAAQTGSGTVHPGKNKGSENNTFTGPIPSTINNLGNLKWFVVNWSDISSIPDEMFQVTSLVGLQIYSNPNIANRTIPASIGTMTNLENLMLGGNAKEWDENTDGFLIGSWPAEIANLTKLRHVWVHNNADLTGFPDLSGNSNLTSLMLNRTDLSGELPSWLFDGSMPNLNLFNISWAEASGLSGSMPEFGNTNLTMFNAADNDLSGSIPASFWNNTPTMKVTDFNYNNLTSIGTTDLTSNTKIRNLRWRDNNIGPEKWPNLDWGNLPNLSRVQFDQNRYVFSNMLYVPEGQSKTIFELYSNLDLRKFSYRNQKPFGNQSTQNVNPGGTITLDDFKNVVTHPDNVYQWQKDGTNISGATDRSLTISDAQSTDAGIYTLAVTNPGVSDLTLTSKEITLTVEDTGGTAPSTPSLVYPADGVTGISTSPILDWNSTSGADSYRIQLASSSDFSSLVVDKSGITATEFQASGLDSSSTYHWRVLASNSNGDSNWSLSRKFSTVNETLPAPVKVSPADGATNTSVSPTFKWESVDGADYYILHANRIDPTEMVITEEVNDTVFTPSKLDTATTHDWRVRAVKDSVKGEWSSIWSFTTGTEPDFSLTISGGEGYRFVSSPATNTTLGDLLSPLWNQGITGSDDPQDEANIFVWNEESSAFEVPSDMSQTMDPGEGFIVYVFEDEDPTVDGTQGGFPKELGLYGTENSSPIDVPITASDKDNSTTIEGQEGWNMVGNPYGVTILVDEILNAARNLNSQVNANLYVWDPTQSGGGGYKSLPEGEGHTIAPFQVFWIRYLEDFEGNLTLDKTKIAATSSKISHQVKNKSELQSSEQFIKFTLQQGDKDSKFFTEFRREGKIARDVLDAYRMTSLNPISGDSTVDLYSLTKNLGERLSTNVLPDTLSEKIEIRLGLKKNKSSNKELVLSWPGFSNIPDGWKIVVEDTKEDKLINLKERDRYVFTMSSVTDDNRFVMHIAPTTSNGEPQSVDSPAKVKLLQNYPNPFNPTTEIKYTIDKQTEVNLTIFNILGKKVKTLVDNQIQSQGTYAKRFDASNLSSGIYIYRLTVGYKTVTKKMTLIK